MSTGDYEYRPTIKRDVTHTPQSAREWHHSPFNAGSDGDRSNLLIGERSASPTLKAERNEALTLMLDIAS